MQAGYEQALRWYLGEDERAAGVEPRIAEEGVRGNYRDVSAGGEHSDGEVHELDVDGGSHRALQRCSGSDVIDLR